MLLSYFQSKLVFGGVCECYLCYEHCNHKHILHANLRLHDCAYVGVWEQVLIVLLVSITESELPELATSQAKYIASVWEPKMG